jgi:hypothetical protein
VPAAAGEPSRAAPAAAPRQATARQAAAPRPQQLVASAPIAARSAAPITAKPTASGAAANGAAPHQRRVNDLSRMELEDDLTMERHASDISMASARSSVFSDSAREQPERTNTTDVLAAVHLTPNESQQGRREGTQDGSGASPQEVTDGRSNPTTNPRLASRHREADAGNSAPAAAYAAARHVDPAASSLDNEGTSAATSTAGALPFALPVQPAFVDGVAYPTDHRAETPRATSPTDISREYSPAEININIADEQHSDRGSPSEK